MRVTGNIAMVLCDARRLNTLCSTLFWQAEYLQLLHFTRQVSLLSTHTHSDLRTLYHQTMGILKRPTAQLDLNRAYFTEAHAEKLQSFETIAERVDNTFKQSSPHPPIFATHLLRNIYDQVDALTNRLRAQEDIPQPVFTELQRCLGHAFHHTFYRSHIELIFLTVLHEHTRVLLFANRDTRALTSTLKNAGNTWSKPHTPDSKILIEGACRDVHDAFNTAPKLAIIADEHTRLCRLIHDHEAMPTGTDASGHADARQGIQKRIAALLQTIATKLAIAQQRYSPRGVWTNTYYYQIAHTITHTIRDIYRTLKYFLTRLLCCRRTVAQQTDTSTYAEIATHALGLLIMSIELYRYWSNEAATIPLGMLPIFIKFSAFGSRYCLEDAFRDVRVTRPPAAVITLRSNRCLPQSYRCQRLLSRVRQTHFARLVMRHPYTQNALRRWQQITRADIINACEVMTLLLVPALLAFIQQRGGWEGTLISAAPTYLMQLWLHCSTSTQAFARKMGPYAIVAQYIGMLLLTAAINQLYYQTVIPYRQAMAATALAKEMAEHPETILKFSSTDPATNTTQQKIVAEEFMQQAAETVGKSINFSSDTVCRHIKSAYNSASLLWHPDKNKTDAAADSFTYLGLAYDIVNRKYGC